MSRVKVLNCVTGLNIVGIEYMLVRYLWKIDPEKYNSSVLSFVAPNLLKRHITDLNIAITAIGTSESQLGLAPFSNLRRKFRNTKSDWAHGWMYHDSIAASIGSMLGSKKPDIGGIHHSVDDIRAEKTDSGLSGLRQFYRNLLRQFLTAPKWQPNRTRNRVARDPQ